MRPVLPLSDRAPDDRARRARLVALAGAAVLASLVLARVPVRRAAGGHGHVVLAEELALALGAAVLVGLVLAARLPVIRDRLVHVLAALALVEVLSAALAPNGMLALRASGMLAAGAALYLVGRACAQASPAPPALWPLLLPVALVAGSVVLEALGALRGLSPRGHSPGGLLGERNAAAQVLVCTAPLLAHLAVRSDRARTRAMACVVAALAAAAVVFSRTRGAWVAALPLGMIGVYLALRTDDRTRGRAAPFAVAVALGISAAPLLPSALAWSTRHPYRDTLLHLVDRSSASGAGRLVQYATTLRMALAHPVVGVGPGNWAGQYLSFAHAGDPTVGEGFWPTNRLPSSDPLGFLAERGAPAFVLAALLLVLACGRGPNAWLRRATATGALLVGSFDAVLQMPCALAMVAWIVGVASAGAPESPRPAPARAERWWMLGAVSVLALSAALAGARLASFVLAARARGLEDLERAARLDPGDIALRLTLAEDWMSDGRCDRARPHLEAALRFAPSSAAAHELDGACAARKE